MVEQQKTRFRISTGGRIGTAIVAGLVLVILVSCVFAALDFYTSSEPVAALLITLIAVLALGLIGYVWRDMQAKWSWRIDIGEDSVEMTLPAGRSHYHRPPRFQGQVAFTEIAFIECRPELYSQFSAESLVETWWLVPKQGEPLFLAEDRNINPTYEIRTTHAVEAATAIAKAAGVPLRRRRQADGHPGILGIWGARPPHD